MMLKERIAEKILQPNFLTFTRIIAVPLIIILLMHDGKIMTFIAAVVFSAASITDYFDGYIARKKGLVSTFGKIIDPIADKILVSSSLVMLVSLDFMPSWIACIIIGRELSITGLRCILAEKGRDVSASLLGKYKTGFQIAAIIPLLMHYEYLGFDFYAIGMFFLYGALILTIWSGIDYFIKAKKIILF